MTSQTDPHNIESGHVNSSEINHHSAKTTGTATPLGQQFPQDESTLPQFPHQSAEKPIPDLDDLDYFGQGSGTILPTTEAPYTNRWYSPITRRVRRGLGVFQPDIENPRTYKIMGCVVIFCCFLLLALSCGTIHSWGIQQEYLLSHEFKGSDASVLSWVGTLQYILMYMLGIPGGWLAETWSYPLTCFAGTICLALGEFLGSYSKEPWQLCLSQGMVFGIGCGLIFTPTSTAPAKWFAKNRGLVTGAAIAGVGVGGLVVSPVTEYLMSSRGIRDTQRISALYILIIGGAASLFVSTPVKKNASQQQQVLSIREAFTWKMFRQPKFVLHVVMCLFAMTAYLIPYTFFSGFAVGHGVSPDKASAVIAIANGASTFGRLFFGLCSDYVGVLNMLSVSLSIATISVFLVWPFAKSFGVQIVFGLLYGAFSGAYWTMVPLAAVKLFGADMLARWSGIIYTMVSFGILLGNPVASAILDGPGNSTNYLPTILYAGALWAAATVAILSNRLLYSRKLFVKE
ncbi:hypothetical protein H4219_004470 [Mycoemilia scoparia]|uniref:Major facilitator superfamily (MFS) profile domain-containing protein n=1 Tax=Mycoemilia scoparia TaxID=417184 RepID=A0A9W7ZSG4_9FUNG|nr:hypothetical protein H4219_004470 [Mycoemilia scoparia]